MSFFFFKGPTGVTGPKGARGAQGAPVSIILLVFNQYCIKKYLMAWNKALFY